MARNPSIFDRRDLSPWLPGYKVIVFDHEGRGTHIIEIDADDDDDALLRARAKAGTFAFELWDAQCMLGRYAPGDGPLDS